MRRQALLLTICFGFVLGSAILLAVPQGRGGRCQMPPSKGPAMYHVGGLRDGASIFPLVDLPQTRPLKAGELDFQHYHTLEETLAFLQKWAKAYPDLIDLYSVGKSFEGRDIWQITLTNKKTGKDTDKPAFFLEGGRHSGEITGIETVLYFVNHLLTNYGKDAAITRLIDTKTFYCKPNNNPDGDSLYQHTAQSNRSTVRPFDDDGDGLLDEDPGEDLDGDGFIRQMRKFVGAGKGNAQKDPADPKGRVMKRVPQGEGDYLTYPEGIDNDNDGRYNEDGIGGLDLHRNYPENWRPMREETGRGWSQGGAGEYPLSETETRAVFSFLMTHPNVSVAQSLDTSVPMLLRPPSTAKTEEAMFPDDAALYAKYDKEGQAITGYPWAGDVYHVYATRSGGNPMTGEPSRDTPLFGHGPDFGYLYFGAIWYGDEIWNGGRLPAADANKDGRTDEIELMRWYDANRSGKDDFQEWTPFKHPQLGDVEIGGWNPKFWSQNPPTDMLETWAKNEAMFNLYLAMQLPQVRLTAVTATPAKGVPAADNVFDVQATVVNEGLMPTALEMAKRVKIVRPDTLTIALGQGQELTKPAAGKPAQGRAIEIGSLKAGETRTVSWQVKGAGKATVAVSSTRGGIDRKDVTAGAVAR
jgi:hypothetical protein